MATRGEHWRRLIERHRATLGALDLSCPHMLYDEDVDVVMAAGDTRSVDEAAPPSASHTAFQPKAQWTRLRRLLVFMVARDVSPQRVQRLLDAVACRRTFPALRICELSFCLSIG